MRGSIVAAVKFDPACGTVLTAIKGRIQRATWSGLSACRTFASPGPTLIDPHRARAVKSAHVTGSGLGDRSVCPRTDQAAFRHCFQPGNARKMGCGYPGSI